MKLTLKDELIRDLSWAIEHRHEHFQLEYSSECGTAACIAGMKYIRDYQLSPPYRLNPLAGQVREYAEQAYQLDTCFAYLVFSRQATYKVHQLAIKILEANLEETIDYATYAELSANSDYFDEELGIVLSLDCPSADDLLIWTRIASECEFEIKSFLVNHSSRLKFTAKNSSHAPT